MSTYTNTLWSWPDIRVRAARAVSFGTLAWRMVVDAPAKSLGTLMGVVVSVFLMVQQQSMLISILGRVTSFVEQTGVDIWITSQATEGTDATGTLPASLVGVAAGTRGVAWASPIVGGFGRVTRPDGVLESVKIVGVEAPRYAGLPTQLAVGTRHDGLRGPARLFLNWKDRPAFAAAQVGDRVEINGYGLTVSGFFKGVDPHSPFYYVFTNLDDARAVVSMPADRTTFVAVGTAPGVPTNKVRDALAKRMPAAMVLTRDELRALEKRYFLIRTPVGVLFSLGTVVAALIGAVIVAVTLYARAVDQLREYGTLMAIGATHGQLLSLLLWQAWCFSGAGFVIGMSLFQVVRMHLPELNMTAPPSLILQVLLASWISCTAASLLAIRRVLASDPAVSFRG